MPERGRPTDYSQEGALNMRFACDQMLSAKMHERTHDLEVDADGDIYLVLRSPVAPVRPE